MKFKESQANGCELYDAWNRNSVYFVKAAEVDESYICFSFFCYFLV